MSASSLPARPLLATRPAAFGFRVRLPQATWRAAPGSRSGPAEASQATYLPARLRVAGRCAGWGAGATGRSSTADGQRDAYGVDCCRLRPSAVGSLPGRGRPDRACPARCRRSPGGSGIWLPAGERASSRANRDRGRFPQRPSRQSRNCRHKNGLPPSGRHGRLESAESPLQRH